MFEKIEAGARETRCLQLMLMVLQGSDLKRVNSTDGTIRLYAEPSNPIFFFFVEVDRDGVSSLAADWSTT